MVESAAQVSYMNMKSYFGDAVVDPVMFTH